MVDLASIQAARRRIAPHVENTPFLHSRTLSAMLDAEIFLKFENLQFTASFKERGALNRLLELDAAQRAAGVIAVSAGNHAQGVAYHANRLGIPAVIVMPRFTPTVKVENTRRFDVEVVLIGETFDDAKDAGMALAQARGLSMIHPYDDAAVIAGQGTLALEMLEAEPSLDMLVIAIGGGGLISGIATAARALKPSMQIIGVQSERFPAMYGAFKDLPVQSGSSSIAEGIAVKAPGRLTVPIVRHCVDDIVLVSESDIEHAIVVLLEIEKTVVEGAGAAGLAALLHAKNIADTRFSQRRIGLVLCGGNIDPLVLGDLIERGMVRAGRLARVRVDLRDLPGALARVTTLLAEAHANIEEVHHQRTFSALPIQSVEVDFVIQTRGHVHLQEVLQKLNQAGFLATAHTP